MPVQKPKKSRGALAGSPSIWTAVVFLNMFPINQPEVMIGNAATWFDAQGNLVDEATKGFVRKLLENLVAWTKQLQQVRSRTSATASLDREDVQQ
jgi:hypothetical protein